jgi:hypothetical protein
MSITIQKERSELKNIETERNHLVSIGLGEFLVSDKSVKQSNIDPNDARRDYVVVVDVRTKNNTEDCLLDP